MTSTNGQYLAVLGPAEIAELLGVQARTVGIWKFRKIMPEADFPLKGGDVWLRTTIERWAKSTGRWPYTRDEEPPLHLPPGWEPVGGWPEGSGVDATE